MPVTKAPRPGTSLPSQSALPLEERHHARPARRLVQQHHADRCAPACRRHCRSGRRRRSCPAGCGTAPGRHRSGRCRRSSGLADGGFAHSLRRALRAAEDRRAHAVGRRRHAADAHAGRVVDGAEDRRRGRDQRRLADALGAEGAERRRDPRSGCTRSPACRRRSGSDSRADSRCGRADIPPSAPGRGPGRCRHRSGLRPGSD